MSWWRRTQNLDCNPRIVHKPRDSYNVYYRSIRQRLPKAIKLLEEKIYLSDANLLKMLIGIDSKQVLLRVITLGGNAPSRVLEVCYRGVSRFKPIAVRGKALPGPSGFGDLGYYEIELLDGGFWEHRLLFSSGLELSIIFNEIELFEMRNRKRVKIA